MALNRRQFLGLLLAGTAAVGCGAWRWVRRVVPTRVVTALPSRRYPGRVQALNQAEVGRPGRWAG
ncbi:MAG: hypothetical protein A3K19_30960 [Lentisphaerae bacterium RIFOXYB12_FULL_65_16]|nr:MAG: hypothetical protein A3K18_03935 [Lentisphaerae bacterium RIFOXYA12_64_32]OGV88839.1 MAG: hypothetical protein A3K19_30960 [Lentisphaerae bacterium RIFOXYB12_FULL_65_16]